MGCEVTPSEPPTGFAPWSASLTDLGGSLLLMALFGSLAVAGWELNQLEITVAFQSCLYRASFAKEHDDIILSDSC